ncbi:SCP domain-containing protein [Psidium guajava]|nr:SCP domain-containing protein [Psidium guajava]
MAGNKHRQLFLLPLSPLCLALHLLLLPSLARFALSEIIFEERFLDGWKSRWVVSDWKRSEGKAGTFKHTAGKWPGDPDDKGAIFDNVLICDDPEYAKQVVEEVFANREDEL